MYDTSTRPFDDVQYNAVEHHAQSKLLDTTFLDQLIIKCIKQKGTALDTDDASRLLDGNKRIILPSFKEKLIMFVDFRSSSSKLDQSISRNRRESFETYE